MNIGIDIDGVLRDQVQAFTNRYLRAYPDHRNLIKPVTSWDMHLFYPLGKEIYKLWFGEWCKDCMEDAIPYIGAVGFIGLLKEQGHKVYLVTSQPRGTEHFTLAWVDKYKFEHDGILFCSNKRLFAGDMLLDDGEHNLRAVDEFVTKPVCFDQPWNQGWDGMRVNSYSQFLKMVAEVANVTTLL
jgi:5'(3')-deoxyribonucleotidase